MPPVKQCLEDLEIGNDQMGYAEEIPKMILKFENQTMVYVYKTHEKAWLEYNPYQLSPTQHRNLLKKLGFEK